LYQKYRRVIQVILLEINARVSWWLKRSARSRFHSYIENIFLIMCDQKIFTNLLSWPKYVHLCLSTFFWMFPNRFSAIEVLKNIPNCSIFAHIILQQCFYRKHKCFFCDAYLIELLRRICLKFHGDIISKSSYACWSEIVECRARLRLQEYRQSKLKTKIVKYCIFERNYTFIVQIDKLKG